MDRYGPCTACPCTAFTLPKAGDFCAKCDHHNQVHACVGTNTSHLVVSTVNQPVVKSFNYDNDGIAKVTYKALKSEIQVCLSIMAFFIIPLPIAIAFLFVGRRHRFIFNRNTRTLTYRTSRGSFGKSGYAEGEVCYDDVRLEVFESGAHSKSYGPLGNLLIHLAHQTFHIRSGVPLRECYARAEALEKLLL